MTKKNTLSLLIILAFVAIVVMALPSCKDAMNIGAREVTKIQVKDTTIYLAPETDARIFQIEPIIFPADAKNKGVYFKHVDPDDRDYLTVGTQGSLYARKLKTDEYGNNIPIYVKLISADNPKVTLEVKVIIETVAVQSVYFKETSMEVELHVNGVQLNPMFKPSHALKGRLLTYRVGNTDIVTVDRSGFLQPKAIGVVDVWAVSKPEGSKEEILAHIMVHVVYAPLNYRMDMLNETHALKQILGSEEKVSFVLNRLDNICDPSPKITWYINNTPINEVGVKDNPALDYVPGLLPVGIYNIVAKLENSSQIQILTSPEINVHYPLKSFNIDAWNISQSYTTGDILRIGATYAIDVFPPESYKWEITSPSRNEVIFLRSTGSMSLIADFEYVFKEAGEYQIRAMAVVKGVPSGVYSNLLKLNVATASHGSDIFGLSLEGKKVGEVYLPYIMWNPLPYETTYQVEIKKGVAGSEVYHTYLMSDPNHKDNFDVNGMYIDEGVASFSESFEYRVKGSRYGWSDWQTYQKGSITPLVHSYFDEIAPGINSYISSIEDFGRLLNYFVIFRPEKWEEGEDTFAFDLFIPLISENLPEGLYTMGGATQPNTEDPEKINLYNLLAMAMGTYVETTSYGLSWGANIFRGGRNQFSLVFNTSNSPTSFEERDPLPELNYITHYAEIPRGEAEVLPIESLSRELPVTTSNQLYWAVVNGYKPVPAPDSSAEKIYKIARKVLYSIIASGMNDEEKVHAIYDWLSANVGYNYSLVNATQTGEVYDSTSDSFFMEGVFRAEFGLDGEVLEILPGIAVCDGISKAFGLLVGMEGIPSYKVTGVLKTASQTGHAWNVVMIGGKWYVVDATWSNEVLEGSWSSQLEYEMLTHKYLFMTDEETRKSREVYGIYPETPVEKCYFAYMTKISEDLDYDSLIDSNEELHYFFSNYLPSMLLGEPEVWTEFLLSEEYLESLYTERVGDGYAYSYEEFISSESYVDDVRAVQNQVLALILGKSMDIMHFGENFYVRLYVTTP